MNELYHHGILGMKWGVRRYQKEDGSYTALGKKRHADTEDARNDLEARKKEGYSIRTDVRVENAKVGLANAKDRERLANETKPKSKARLKYEEQYKQKGYSDEDAAVAAMNKERVMKTLKIAGAVALTAAVAAGAYKYHEYVTDTVLDTNVDLMRFAKKGSGSIHDTFYATPNKRDARKYVGMMGTLNFGGEGGVQKTIRLRNKVKVASEKSARKIMQDLVDKDSSFKNDLASKFDQYSREFMMMGNESSKNLMSRAAKNIREGKINKDTYDALNIAFVDRDNSQVKTFVDSLKKHGYGAIVDTNDKRRSGYNTIRPLIIFDASNANVTKMREVGREEVAKLYNREVNEATAKALGILGGGATAAIAGTRKATNALTKSAWNKRIRDYKREHPGTKMTDTEILDSLRGVD